MKSAFSTKHEGAVEEMIVKGTERLQIILFLSCSESYSSN